MIAINTVTPVTMTITCPDPTDDSVVPFSIYIDPSGTVVDSALRPISGATVTLDGSSSSLEKLAAGDHVSISSSSDGTTVFATDSSFTGAGHGPGGPGAPGGPGGGWSGACCAGCSGAIC